MSSANPNRIMRAVDVVSEALRERITTGALALGERLPPEARLAEEFGVGRAVIREALRSLNALGLVETKNGVGTRVVATASDLLPVGDYSARDMYEVRLHVEVPATGYAATRMQQFGELEELCRQMESTDDPQLWGNLNKAFHLAIVRGSGNAAFLAMLSALMPTFDIQERLLKTRSKRLSEADEEHRAILAALKSGSPEEAEEAARIHVRRGTEELTRVLTTAG